MPMSPLVFLLPDFLKFKRTYIFWNTKNDDVLIMTKTKNRRMEKAKKLLHRIDVITRQWSNMLQRLSEKKLP